MILNAACLAADLTAANDYVISLGHGPCFTVPLGKGGRVTHYGFSASGITPDWIASAFPEKHAKANFTVIYDFGDWDGFLAMHGLEVILPPDARLRI
jgi:hypothetical protein